MNRKFLPPRAAAALLLVLPAGCVAFDKTPLDAEAPPPPAPPCQLSAFWDTRIHFTPDPTHNGAQTPTLAGRVYLWGPQMDIPLTGDGSLSVVAYDGSAPNAPDAVPLEAWQFDPDTLHRLLKKDVVGWGYTLPLPWPDLPPTLTRVRMRVCYQASKGGAPLYSDSAPVALDNALATPAGPVVTQSAKPRS
jgi:hypothetical protein